MAGKMLVVMVTLSLCYRLSESVHKNIVDFDDSDMERLFQQWEVGLNLIEGFSLLNRKTMMRKMCQTVIMQVI